MCCIVLRTEGFSFAISPPVRSRPKCQANCFACHSLRLAQQTRIEPKWSSHSSVCRIALASKNRLNNLHAEERIGMTLRERIRDLSVSWFRGLLEIIFVLVSDYSPTPRNGFSCADDFICGRRVPLSQPRSISTTRGDV